MVLQFQLALIVQALITAQMVLSISIGALTTIRFSSEPQNINNRHMYHDVDNDVPISQDIIHHWKINFISRYGNYFYHLSTMQAIWWRPSEKTSFNTSLEYWDEIQRILMLFSKSTYFKTTTTIKI